jgi:hypothetical protein
MKLGTSYMCSYESLNFNLIGLKPSSHKGFDGYFMVSTEIIDIIC